MRRWGSTFSDSAAFACSLLLLVSFLSGCAAIVNGSSQALQFTSDPPGAQVFVNGSLAGATPLTAKVDRHAPGTVDVIFKKDGYEDKRIYLEHELSKLFWFDFLLFPIVGLLADTLTAAINVYEPTIYHATLNLAQQAPGK